MASETWPTPSDLTDRLQREPYRFDFFQAMRRLEAMHADRPGVGMSHRPSEDYVRLGQAITLSFAPTTLAEYVPATVTGPAWLRGYFFGFLGPNGPMPLHLTEYIYGRQLNESDAAPARFLDMLQNRMIALFFRAWAVNHQAVSFDRGKEDRFAVYIASLIGMGMKSMRDRDAVDDLAKLHFSGHLTGQTRHPDGLERLLCRYFGVRCETREFIGQWITLPDDSLCRVGESRHTGLMGRNIVVGSRVWDCQQCFRLRLGPMGLADFRRFLPTRDSFSRLVAWVDNYQNDPLRWEAQLVLRREEIPPIALGEFGELGWTTWLHAQSPTQDADDLVLQVPAA